MPGRGSRSAGGSHTAGKHTLLYLGESGVNIANGAITGKAAVLQRAFVDNAGQIPG